MKELELRAKIRICDESELTETQKSVVEAAKKATLTSYAPYSRFHVGAAVLLDDGEILTGSNQENAAYPSGTCAERTVLFYAGAHRPDAKVTTLAIAARSADGRLTPEVCSPCGACRQVILESQYRAGRPIEILLCSATEVYVVDGIEPLLPLGFDYDSLKLGQDGQQ